MSAQASSSQRYTVVYDKAALAVSAIPLRKPAQSLPAALADCSDRSAPPDLTRFAVLLYLFLKALRQRRLNFSEFRVAKHTLGVQIAEF